jgi:hypothetical protein
MTKDNLPIWYNQISFRKSKRIITNGLTIPYIIGSYNFLGHAYSINELMNEIINSNLDKCAVIQKCPEIRQYVIGIEDKNFCEKYFQNEISFTNSDNVKSLIITQNASDLGNNLKKITDIFINLYKNDLDEGKYSWDNRNKGWIPLNDYEQRLIINAVKK